jgi:rubrerythrin
MSEEMQVDEAGEKYRKGEPVPRAGTYRCTECGERWTASETGVRFPPCEVNKTGHAEWVLVANE